MSRPMYNDCLLPYFRPYPHVCTVNWNKLNGRSLWRVSITTSCQLTVQWPGALSFVLLLIIDIRRRAVKLLMCYTLVFNNNNNDKLLLLLLLLLCLLLWFLFHPWLHQSIFSKLKEKIPTTQTFRFFSYVRETLTVLGTGFRRERNPK